MLERVPTVRTTYTKDKLIQGFIEGWKLQFGVFPKKESIAVIWAQNAIETGSTGSMWNNNIGNVKVLDIAGQTIKYCALSGVWELVNGKRVNLTVEDPGSWFRSFDTLADGIAFHFNFLKNKRYKLSWAAVEAGDPKQFSHLLKIAGYYTAPEAQYTSAVVAYYNKFMKDPTFDTVLTSLQAPVPEPLPAPEPVLEPVPEPEPIPELPPVVEVPEPIKPKSPFDFIKELFFPLLKLFNK